MTQLTHIAEWLKSLIACAVACAGGRIRFSAGIRSCMARRPLAKPAVIADGCPSLVMEDWATPLDSDLFADPEPAPVRERADIAA